MKLVSNFKNCQDITEPTNPEYCKILIIQITSGSTGHNLQMFNHIYFTSLHWTPTVEMQAIARAHRIGQTKNVHIKKFAMNSENFFTIEQRILSKQLSKRELIADFLNDDNIRDNGTIQNND